MKTQRFEVARLRGIDNRWRASPDSAAVIKEMSWDAYDGWKQAGGYDAITNNLFDWSDVGKSAVIKSIHYYSIHNGANRHVLFETENGSLCRLNPRAFNRPTDPFIVIQDQDGVKIDSSGRPRHIFNNSEVATQSATFGGRIYLVNGEDQPSVYDGRSLSRAGFSDAPSSPSGSVIQRSYHNQYIDDGGVGTDYFLGTRVRGQGLGSVSPKGLKAMENTQTHKSYVWKSEITPTNDYVDGKLCGYQYRVSFVNKRGQESPLSQQSEICMFECAGGKTRFVKVDIPVGPDDVVARRIYRTVDIFDDYGNSVTPEIGRNFYMVKEVQDNETTSIEDGVTDSNLGYLVDDADFGIFPAQSRFIASFKNTLFLAGMTDNILKYSAEGMPEIFPRGNLFDIGDSDSGQITALYATNNALVVFKDRGIYLVKGNQRQGFSAQTLNKDIGCISPGSIQDVPGTGLVFLSVNGVYVLKGALENTGTPTSVIELSTPIDHLIKRIDRSNSNSSVSVINRNDKEYLLCVPTLGKDNNLLLVWHYEVGAWSFRENYPMQCVIETKDSRSNIYFGSNDESIPGMHVLSNFYNKKNEAGSRVPGQKDGIDWIKDYPLYETSPFEFSSIYSSIQVAYINVYAIAYGNDPLKVNFKINRSESVSLSENKSRKQQDISEPLPVYGSATFDDNFVWGFHRPVVLRYDISHMHKSLVTEFSVQFTQDEKNETDTTTSNRMMVVGYSLDAKVGEQRNIRSLTDVFKIDKR
jgi:hypothetical protein